MYATVQELVDALTLEEKAGLCTGAAVPRPVSYTHLTLPTNSRV